MKDGRKLHCCFYCGKWYYRIPHHISRRHKFEPRVAKILTLCQKSHKEFAKLRREDDYKSNISKLKNKDFNITVVKSGKYDLHNSLFCPTCHGFYNRVTLKKHSLKCGTAGGGVMVKDCRMLASVLAIDKKFDNFSAEIMAFQSCTGLLVPPVQFSKKPSTGSRVKVLISFLELLLYFILFDGKKRKGMHDFLFQSDEVSSVSLS